MNGPVLSPDAPSGSVPARIQALSLPARHPGAAGTWPRRASPEWALAAPGLLPAVPDPDEGLQGELLSRNAEPHLGALTYLALGRRSLALGPPRSIAVDLFA